MNSKPSFLKFIASSEKMDFPRGTAARIGGIRCGVAFLMEGHHAWEVGVERDGDGFSFNKGWPHFYRENRLEHEDCVVFTYHGNNLFHFQLFGRDSFEKKTTGGPILSVEEEVEEFSDDDDDDDDVELEVESEEERRVPCRRKCSRNVSSIHTLGEKRAYKKQNVPDYYGHDIFESGLAIQPKNPYFVSRSRKARRNELYIPRDVIVDFRLEIPTTLFVVDGTGRKWKAKMNKWKDGRVWCSIGWKSLCSVNNIGLDDTCICEFVKQGQGGMCLHVRVVDVAPHAASN